MLHVISAMKQLIFHVLFLNAHLNAVQKCMLRCGIDLALAL